ncbi:hypothetical protein ACGFZK_13780 [Streptomyces sp. NPDC048257]|uniref:hypothetical protein n=1 Tax=Streptomyces sp. NPDC048257 TaxID=3365526 RepID=UPI00371CA608
MTPSSPARQLADHVRRVLGDGPFRLPGGWFHMGAVICDASFQARTRYVSTLRPRLLRLQEEWPDGRNGRTSAVAGKVCRVAASGAVHRQAEGHGSYY